jgi:hypothetical protein
MDWRPNLTDTGKVKRPVTGPSGRVLHAAFEPLPDGSQRVVFAGPIDENSDLESVFAKLTGDATFNLLEVTRVNSMGVHRWIPLVTAFSARHHLVIEEISYALVHNANAVANLFGSATVTSCVAPYFCGGCKENVSVTVTREEVIAADHAPPQKHCMRCNSSMEFDELDGYFAFFKSRQKR